MNLRDKVDKLYSFTLADDHETIQNTKLDHFIFMGIPYDGKVTWASMFRKVLQTLHTKNRTVLPRLAKMEQDTRDMAHYVIKENINPKRYFEIEPGVYVYQNDNPDRKLLYLERFFELFGTDPHELRCFYRPR